MIVNILIVAVAAIAAYYFGKFVKGKQIAAAVEADLVKAEKSVVAEAKTLAAAIRAKL